MVRYLSETSFDWIKPSRLISVRAVSARLCKSGAEGAQQGGLPEPYPEIKRQMKGDNAFAVREQHVSWIKKINCVFSPSFSRHPNKISSINRVSYEWLDCVWAWRGKNESEESGSILPMIKTHPNCFDSIEDLGCVRALFGADRGWCLRITDTRKGLDWYIGCKR